MSLEGRIHNGTVVFNEPVPLAEGTRVLVEPLPASTVPPQQSATSFLDRLGDVVGAVDDLPADLAENHDHYLYGTPRRR